MNKVLRTSISAVSALVAAAAAVVVVSCDGGSSGGAAAGKRLDLTNEHQRVSYAFGRDLGNNIKEIDSLDFDALVTAMREVISDQPSQLPDSALTAINTQLKRHVTGKLRERQRQQHKEQSENNLAAAQAFMEKNKSADGVVTTESGLQYVVIAEGKGARPKLDDQVRVHVHGAFLNGTVFEDTRGRGEPAVYRVDGVTKGWAEALQLMKVGGKAKIFIPPELAYGKNGRRARGSNRAIEPNMALIFEVELIEIVKP